MKKLSTLLFICLGFSSIAQEPCSTGRYSTDVYSNVTTTSNIVYGSNYSFSNAVVTLKLDFYEPQADTATKRPLIIWIHGGSFLGGSKTDGDMVTLSNRFAKKGYACASLDYRTGFFPIDSANALKAVLRAVHDAKAAIRYFYKDAQTTNTYKIDTTNIFIGGSSAGAITALHMAYLNRTCEITENESAYFTQAYLDQVGGAEGVSGNPCYSTKVKGVINLAGALAKYYWLEAGDVPVVSCHGTNDGTVGYSRQIVNPGVPLMYLDGSRMLHERAAAVGVDSRLYTFYGADHVPHASNAQYMDTTVNFVRDFLIDQLGCSDAPLQTANTPFGTANLYAFTPCTNNVPFNDCTALSASELDMETFAIYPNPTSQSFTLETGSNMNNHVMIVDMNGRIVAQFVANSSQTKVDVSNLNEGIYFVKIQNQFGNQTIKLIKE
ncbi:MAG: T9SS type A sorting domain-containing protein [Bacteroidia bacterium]|nr:MAG: T9SS type A sorting domain-containing protein [Bacteroidia bacterium]